MLSGAMFSNNLEDPKSDPNVMWSVATQGDGKVRDFLKSIASAEPPGLKFAYNDGNAQVLGWLVDTRHRAVVGGLYVTETLATARHGARCHLDG